MKFEHYKTRNGSEIDIPIPTPQVTETVLNS